MISKGINYFCNFVQNKKYMLKFISLGSGSSGNCYFLYTETDGLLIDAGVGVRSVKRCLKKYGIPLNRAKHMIITHDHADHVKAVGSVSRDFNLPVYSTLTVHVGINNNYCVRCKIDSSRVRIFEKGDTITLGSFTITSFDVPHDSLDSVGYRIQVGDIVFCIMTDVGHLTDEMKKYIGETNYLIIEANYDLEMLKAGTYPEHLKARILSENGHMSNAECGVALAENITHNLKHAWLCHLSEENNHPELARKTVEQILRSYGIIAGKDFQLDVLKRTTPSEVFELT